MAIPAGRVSSSPAAAADLYLAAFQARWDAMRSPGRPHVDEPGVCGLLGGSEDPRVRLLVTDDRAHDVLAGLLPGARAGLVSIFDTAQRCVQLADRRLGWSADSVRAMVCRDLATVPALTLPDELALRPVQRLTDDGPDGVALADAVATAVSASPAITEPPAAFAAFLRSLPPPFRLFAAVDPAGVVRATSGCGVFAGYATVIFVNTAPGWRGRGIGQAMTAQALRAGLRSGARCACLDASAAGESIYRRLGFADVGTVTRFLRPG